MSKSCAFKDLVMPFSPLGGKFPESRARGTRPRKRRSVYALRWTCGVKPKPKGVNTPSKHYMMRVQDENNPVSLLQCPFCEVIFHPIGPKATPLLRGHHRI